MTSGFEKSLSDIQSYLEKFEGGQINLNLNRENCIATLCLNYPEKRNAISGKMIAELSERIRELEAWNEGKGVIIYGAGGTFCSGGDLNFVRAIATPDEGYLMATFMQDTLSRLQKLPMLSVALVNGCGALGGGAELAVSCDFRLATDNSAGIGFLHANLGIIPAWGGATRLVKLVGYPKALNILATAEVYQPEYCKSIGLVDEIITPDDCLEQTTRWLGVRTRHNVSVVRAMKKAVVDAHTMSATDALHSEKKTFAPLWGAAPNKDALAKFFQLLKTKRLNK